MKWNEWNEGRARAVRIKRAGFLTKLVVLALIIAASVTLLRMRGQIEAAQAQREELRMRVATQTQTNADLRDAIEHSEDPDRQIEIARSKLGLVTPGEKVIVFTD